ncbi:hypothetical protein [Flavobacterium praedii]|uniref:hypothetical protein n=1 Tax=Flavobacterium praedii TaxID=3002900 RepID=UPI002481EDE7|nr:hypothetical protein [Flavobacterium praedii]
MKTKLQLAAIIASFFAFQMSAQNRTTINAMNSEISDNLDLTAVSSIFGESQNLSDFEKRLNDPKLQISNLDLNNDNRVDYLRVIESIEKRTHIIIIQSIIGRDLYQDVATIEIEKNRRNNISIQIVGNAYIYGQNYIYEPEYCYTPQIFTTFWAGFYKPYYSSWTWNYYPTYYYAWNPFPVYRYQKNIYGCVNYNNTYNYVSYRRCNRAPYIYNSYSCNSYEKQYPEYNFSRRNSKISNRYELDQRRTYNNNGLRNELTYSRNYSGNSSNNGNYNYNNNSQRDYSQNRTNNSREINTQSASPQRDYSQSRTSTSRDVNPQSTSTQRDYSQSRTSTSRDVNPQSTTSQRDYSQSRTSTSRDVNPQSTTTQRDYSQNRASSTREENTQRSEPQRGNNYSSRSTNRRI